MKKFPGRGMHEIYLPTTGKGHANKRDRRKCKYYIQDTKRCTKLFNFCVGPTLCQKYQESLK